VCDGDFAAFENQKKQHVHQPQFPICLGPLLHTGSIFLKFQAKQSAIAEPILSQFCDDLPLAIFFTFLVLFRLLRIGCCCDCECSHRLINSQNLNENHLMQLSDAKNFRCERTMNYSISAAILLIIVLGVEVQAQLTLSRYLDANCSQLAPSPDDSQGVANPLVLAVNACVMIFNKTLSDGSPVRNFNKLASCAADNKYGSYAYVALYGDHPPDDKCNGSTLGPRPFSLGICMPRWYGPSDTLYSKFMCATAPSVTSAPPPATSVTSSSSTLTSFLCIAALSIAWCLTLIGV
jgi:hypothetical protein